MHEEVRKHRHSSWLHRKSFAFALLSLVYCVRMFQEETQQALHLKQPDKHKSLPTKQHEGEE